MRKTRTKLQQRVATIHRDEFGASYSVSVILLMPLFAICVAFAVEVILLCNSYQAVTAALQTASHVSRAWIVHRDELEANSLTLENLIQTASARSMAAFATTRVREESPDSSILRQAIQESGMEAFASDRYSQKSAFIAEHLRVSLLAERRETDGLLIQLEYDSPLWFSVFAPVFATTSDDSQFYSTIRREQWVPLDEASATLTNLGIPYLPSKAISWTVP